MTKDLTYILWIFDLVRHLDWSGLLQTVIPWKIEAYDSGTVHFVLLGAVGPQVPRWPYLLRDRGPILMGSCCLAWHIPYRRCSPNFQLSQHWLSTVYCNYCLSIGMTFVSHYSAGCRPQWPRDQWFWQNFINSMCGIKFFKGDENLRSVYKKQIFEILTGLFHFWPYQLSKKFIVPSKRWKLFFLEVLAKKLFYQLKICPSPTKSVFWAKLILGALFTKVICTFLKSVWKDGFFDTPFDLIKEKKFSSQTVVGSVWFYFYH